MRSRAVAALDSPNEGASAGRTDMFTVSIPPSQEWAMPGGRSAACYAPPATGAVNGQAPSSRCTQAEAPPIVQIA